MKEIVFQQTISNPTARINNYQEMVRAYYDRVTQAYRQEWGDSFHFAAFAGTESQKEAIAATELRIADEGGFQPGMKILDIGCGVGGPAFTIAKYSGAHVTGVNIHEGQVAIARQRATEQGLSEQTDFVIANAMQMPFPDESFDGIYIFEAGCHMPDKAAFYQECARVLRPGGVFLGNDWMCREGLTPEEKTRYIEPICRFHAVPNLVSLAELHNYLVNANLKVQALGDIAEYGSILRNWELMDNIIVQNIHKIVPWLIPPTLRMLTDGGYALLEAAKVGAFLIGYWRVRK